MNEHNSSKGIGMPNDATLLQNYAQTRDAEAFAELVRRHAGPVYGTYLRITGNAHDAEDVAQECFLELARKAGTIASSVPGWLHAAATSRSLNAIRNASTRRRHEEQAMNSNHDDPEPKWDEIAPHVDRALEELPDDLRVPLVLHYVEARSQKEIADELGVNQSTVSRRIDSGLAELRGKLAKAGIVASVAVLGALLAENAASAAPATLAASLGKMALAGVGEAGAAASSGAASTAGASFLTTLGGKIAAAVAAVVLVAGAIVAVHLSSKDDAVKPVSPRKVSEPVETIVQSPEITAKGTTAVNKPTSVVLPNLRPMVSWDKGQNFQVNGYLQFQMECLGESRDYDYWFFAGVGGDAHTQVFTADTSKWCHSLSQIDFGPEFAKTLYDAVGYDFAYVTEQQFNADRPRYVGELVKCIDRGIPVIAKETGSSTRTKAQEFSLLVGYEDGGGQLLFVEGDSTKPHKVPTNQHVSFLFVIPGAKKQAHPLADAYRKAVLNIPELLTRPHKGDLYYGREAFDAWAKHLLTENYVGWTDEKLDIWMQHTTYVCIVATNGSELHFLERAMRLCPDLPFLPDVFKEYAEMGRLWKDEMDATGGSFNITKQTLRNKEAKRPIAEFIQRYIACCDRILEIYRANGYTRETGVGLPAAAVDKKNTEQTPKGVEADLERLPRSKTLEGVISPDEPWVGGCQYLLCFTSLLMHTEKHNGNTDFFADPKTRDDFNGNLGFNGDNGIALMNRERIYKVFLTVTGMGLANSWRSNGNPFSYEVAKDYVARSMSFAGYEYEVVENTGKDVVMAKIRVAINSNVPVLARYKSEWELVIGYDIDKDTLTIRKGGGSVSVKDYADGVEYLVCVTGTDREKSDLKTVISGIIETMETGGEGFGPQAYYEAIEYFSNDEFFENADDDTLKKARKHQVYDFFVGHAEARGFSGMGFSWRFMNRNTADMTDTLHELGVSGDQHHQIAWSGDHLCGEFGNLRDRSVRQAMIYVIYQMIENDMITCRLLKKLIGLDTPDALKPLARKTGKMLNTQIQTKEMTVNQVMAKTKVKSIINVDFDNDLMPPDNKDWQIENGAVVIKSAANQENSMTVNKDFTLPFKIDMRVKTDSTNIHLYYRRGNVLLEGWRHLPGELRIADITTGLDLGYAGRCVLQVDRFMDVSWIVHRDFTAVIVDGEVRHYGENYPYMNIGDIPAGKIRFGAAKGSTVTVEQLAVSELE